MTRDVVHARRRFLNRALTAVPGALWLSLDSVENRAAATQEAYAPTFFTADVAGGLGS